jgi:hypothetical protein
MISMQKNVFFFVTKPPQNPKILTFLKLISYENHHFSPQNWPISVIFRPFLCKNAPFLTRKHYQNRQFRAKNRRKTRQNPTILKNHHFSFKIDRISSFFDRFYAKTPLFDPKTLSKPSISAEKPPKNASKTGRWREFGGSFQHLRTSNTVVLIDRADGNGPYVVFIYIK